MTNNEEQKAEYYIQINDNGIADIIKGNAQEMLKQYGEISPSELANDLTDINLYNVYDKDNNLIKSNINSVRKGKEYWENFTDEYIKELKERLNQDITGISQEDLTKKIIYHNNQFLNAYMFHIQRSALDLADEGVRFNYAKRLTNALIEIQLQEIQKIGINTFLNTNIKSLPKDFIHYIELDSLKAVQESVKSEVAEFKEYIKNEPPIKDYKPKNDDEIAYKYLSSDLEKILLIDQIGRAEQVYQNDKDFFDKRHKKRETISKLLKDISQKYQEVQDKLDLDNKQDKENNELTTTTDYKTENNELVSVKRTKTKLPNIITIDYDILKLFSNIYPNYKYKSIDDDRHKDIDIKAMLMLDLDINENIDSVKGMENLRLLNFIQSGKIAVYPVQSALIDGFISLRDEQDSIDRVIPLLSTLQHITENKKLRLTKSKKDLALYEDYMLFFKRCKIQIKITNRKTKEVLFEIMNPIPLLENTPAYKDGKYGYIIGNSVINILKNEFDSLRDKKYMTTTPTNKGYLSSKLPTTPSTINLTYYIFPKIQQMINAYKTKGKYQSVINIELLYDYQAQYNKHHIPNKEDKNSVRDMLNKYLDELKIKGLIESYEPLKRGKEINQYKITLVKPKDM